MSPSPAAGSLPNRAAWSRLIVTTIQIIMIGHASSTGPPPNRGHHRRAGSRRLHRSTAGTRPCASCGASRTSVQMGGLDVHDDLLTSGVQEPLVPLTVRPAAAPNCDEHGTFTPRARTRWVVCRGAVRAWLNLRHSVVDGMRLVARDDPAGSCEARQLVPAEGRVRWKSALNGPGRSRRSGVNRTNGVHPADRSWTGCARGRHAFGRPGRSRGRRR